MSAERLRELMQVVYDSHRRFHEEWDKGPHDRSRWKEPPQVTSARNTFFDALHRLFFAQLDLLRKSFTAGDEGAVDGVIDFLSINIPAFRCGYEKERYLRRLKSVSLSAKQRRRLRGIALDLVSTPHYLRELGDWGRLMIVIADEPFVANLGSLLSSPEHFTQQNARRMLKTILENRRDLSDASQAGGF